nr:hypothetical protein [uncultured bacterium]
MCSSAINIDFEPLTEKCQFHFVHHYFMIISHFSIVVCWSKHLFLLCLVVYFIFPH